MTLRVAVLPLLVGGAVLLLDVESKIGVRQLPAPVYLASGVVLTVAENPRGPLSTVPLPLTLGLSAAVLGVLCWLVWQSHTTLERVAMSIILGGGIANFAERLATGRVTDILVIADRATWNVADVAILLGAMVLVGVWLTRLRRRPRPCPWSFAKAQRTWRSGNTQP